MQDLLPVAIGGVQLREGDAGPMTALMPFPGKAGAVSSALEAAHGVRWPEIGRMTGTPACCVLWFGREQALLIGVKPDAGLVENAAMVDQSDAWAVVEMSGAGAAHALARLTPIDLRDAVFGIGHTARTELGHMAASVTRTSSMTRTRSPMPAVFSSSWALNLLVLVVTLP